MRPSLRREVAADNGQEVVRVQGGLVEELVDRFALVEDQVRTSAPSRASGVLGGVRQRDSGEVFSCEKDVSSQAVV